MAQATSLLRFRNHTSRHTAIGKTPLDDGSTRRRQINHTTLNIHKGQTSMTPAVFEPVVSPSDRPRSRGHGDRPLLIFVFLCPHRIHKWPCIPIKSTYTIILTLVPCNFYCSVQWTTQHTARLNTYRAATTTATTYRLYIRPPYRTSWEL